MINPFDSDSKIKINDESLVESALTGKQKSLETLIERHQAWIYNIALRMLCHPDEAQDATQDILIKMITGLSSFKGKSAFRTWLYRIVKNHVLNMKKGSIEPFFMSFEQFAETIDEAPDNDLPDEKSLPIDHQLLLEEMKISCLIAMLLCLDREQRLIFILGEVFRIDDTLGSELFEISKDNFRQRLSRTRKQLINFMSDKCGLIKESNSCHCDKKTQTFIDYGYVDPHNLLFATNYVVKIKEVSQKKAKTFDRVFDEECMALFQEHPFQKPPNYVDLFRKMIDKPEFKTLFNF